MASIKDLKKRIGSVKNTQQITKAMKMVSAAKLRRAQDAIHNHRPYAKRIGSLIKLVSSMADEDKLPALVYRKSMVLGSNGEANSKKRVLVVLVTSDRGLCGPFNGNIIKTAQRWYSANKDAYEQIQFAFVGRRGYDFFKTKEIPVWKNFAELGGKVTFLKAKKLADELLYIYLSEEPSERVDEIKFIYNEFKNVMSQHVVVEDFLPLGFQSISNIDGLTSESHGTGVGATADHKQSTPKQSTDIKLNTIDSFIIRPNHAELLQLLLEKHFAVQTFRILLESQAGEHGARMSAMENATKNAGEMIQRLTLQFNKQRQAGITKELLEIISGSESQKG